MGGCGWGGGGVGGRGVGAGSDHLTRIVAERRGGGFLQSDLER